MDSYEVKEVFEGFASINEIDKDEETRFKELIDDLDNIEEETVTASEEVLQLIEALKNRIVQDLDEGKGVDMAVVGNCNDLILELMPPQKKNKLEEMNEEELKT